MTSTEDSVAMDVQVSVDSPQVASVDTQKKNTFKPQNGRSNRGKDNENRPSSKDSAPRFDDDDDDETDLVPPEPVLEPNAEENNALLGVIRRELDELEQRVVFCSLIICFPDDEFTEKNMPNFSVDADVLMQQVIFLTGHNKFRGGEGQGGSGVARSRREGPAS